ncbi:FprA family A-type flavoprotein [Coprobacillus sp. TM10-10]|jgi:flavorubredoxin|uniref:FprA family A-type flavoprotein n=1 Tax=Faecalibacillus intestinalis TaxID=1982626 RepID=UPI000E47D8B1|nr:FprA family A-type flavoprotein [Faecalibacillus intestinalis]RGF83217.1 FprA family A-type flavoprotein [Coprobacillus sp. OF02-11LB]RGG94396.1 FprA family A-type flavoprotein [Coprobacillus sp. AF16-47]RGH25366.1 FprA family A-type flavoprotein [Coprobacillus sp. AF02-13]RGI00085.1 FprA family A-type flavoprotein [Coprobacillus sp. AM26-5AC]RGI01608.1 FprA family A-type flavoprotein [Coprobacillus sp. TM10-10]
MNNITISESIKYIGVDDTTLDLFESQYIVPHGVSYNSYLILDEKIAVMDTVDARKTKEWFDNLDKELKERVPDYLIVSHLEPDHSANIQLFTEKYKEAKLVLSAKAKAMLPQFFNIEGLDERCIVVKEGEELDLGNHHLKFIMAPMVHWPEVMVEYETTEKVLFSADGFGKFGALSHDEDWACEARRYYFNIVGKYGAPVQTLLKKASTLDIKMICPLHGPILKDNLGYYIDKYQIWSSYQSEDEGVLVASASIHGNTKEVALKVVDLLKEKGVKVAFTDLTRDDMAEAVEDAFRYSKMILAGATYDGGVFSPMEDFLHRLQHKGYQKKTVGLIENGSWAPLANKVMKEMLTPMKNVTICENTVTIKSTYKDENQEAINQLVEEICH